MEHFMHGIGAAGVLAFAVIGILIFLAGLVLPLVVWQMNNRIGLLEQRAYAMRKMMRLCEDHLRTMRQSMTGEQLEPRDPSL